MNARAIGQRIAIQFATLGLIVAYSLMTLLLWQNEKGLWNLNWILQIEFIPHLLVGIVGIYIGAIILGRLSAHQIIERQRNALIVGIGNALLTLTSGTLFGCTLGFLQEGLDNVGSADNPFYDYYFKPFYWIFLYGLISTILLGACFGSVIKRKGAYHYKPD